MNTCKLRCTLGRSTFSVTLDMVLNLPLNIQKSTSSILEFSTVETTPLFDIFFRGCIAEVDQAHWRSLLGSMKCNHLDEIYEMKSRDEVEDSQRTRTLTKFTAIYSIFTICVKSVPFYHFKLAHVVLHAHMAVKDFQNPHSKVEKKDVLMGPYL